MSKSTRQNVHLPPQLSDIWTIHLHIKLPESEIICKMKTSNYGTTLLVDHTPKEVFKSINNVSCWWSTSFEGHSEKLNDVFTVHFGETYITVKIVELIPNKKILWHVIDCYKHWLKDKKEWKGTKMSWEISTEKNATQIRFTHIGLVPGIECYEGCEEAWNSYINESLFKLINKGKGTPELK
jgi:Activator of Hsp90 ATPase homolog 1-like protein